MADGATLVKTQYWLAHSLRKAGTFKYSSLRNSVFDLSFNGCRMTFTSEVEPRDRMTNWPAGGIDIPDGDRVSKGPNGPSGAIMESGRSTESILNGNAFSTPFSDNIQVRDRFTFDLGQIDPDLTIERTFNLRGGEKKATYLILFADEATVEVKRMRAREPELQRTVSIALRPEDAETIKDGFHRAVRLCRADQ